MKIDKHVDNALGSATHIFLYAPSQFPIEDYLKPNEQMTLDSAYDELRSNLTQLSAHLGDSSQIEECRIGTEESYQNFLNGNGGDGIRRIQDVIHILMSIAKAGG